MLKSADQKEKPHYHITMFVVLIIQQSSSDTGCSDRTSRFRMRRQKREAAQEVKFSGKSGICHQHLNC